MSSVKIPCPACAAALTLDENTAGTHVVCPDCWAEMTMPAIVDGALFPTLLSDGRPEAHAPRIPARRSQEPHNSQDAGESWEQRGLLSDLRPSPAPLPQPPPQDGPRLRTKLPERRNIDGTPATGAHQPTEETDGGPSSWAEGEATPPAARRPEGPGPRREHSLPVRDIRPIPVKPDEVLQPGALPQRAPSRRPSPALASPAPASESGEPSEAAGTAAKGGHRLGEDRQLHFTPFVAGTGDVETAEWSGEGKEPGKSKRMAILAAVLVVLLGAAYGVYLVKYGNLAAPSAGVETEAQRTKKAAPNPLENLEAARKVLARFFAATSVDEMVKEVRHPEITRPRIEKFLAGKPVKPRIIESEGQAWNEVSIGETDFITGALSMDDFRIANVALEIQKDGQLKVDWESYANWAEVLWPDFLKNQPDEAVEQRVTVMPIRYYNYAFEGKEAEMLAFRLEDPERYGYCYAYCHKDTPAAATLIGQLRKARRLGRVTKEGAPIINCILRIKYPQEGKIGNQTLIEEFVSDSWILP